MVALWSYQEGLLLHLLPGPLRGQVLQRQLHGQEGARRVAAGGLLQRRAVGQPHRAAVDQVAGAVVARLAAADDGRIALHLAGARRVGPAPLHAERHFAVGARAVVHAHRLLELVAGEAFGDPALAPAVVDHPVGVVRVAGLQPGAGRRRDGDIGRLCPAVGGAHAQGGGHDAGLGLEARGAARGITVGLQLQDHRASRRFFGHGSAHRGRRLFRRHRVQVRRGTLGCRNYGSAAAGPASSALARMLVGRV